jgi:hypothetical protein
MKKILFLILFLHNICYGETINLYCKNNGTRGGFPLSIYEKSNGSYEVYMNDKNVNGKQGDDGSGKLVAVEVLKSRISISTESYFPPTTYADPKFNLSETFDSRTIVISRVDGTFVNTIYGKGGLYSALPDWKFPTIIYGVCETRKPNKF